MSGLASGSRMFFRREPGTLASKSRNKPESFASGWKSRSEACAEQCSVWTKGQRSNGEFSVRTSDLVSKKAVQHFVAESRCLSSQLENRAIVVVERSLEFVQNSLGIAVRGGQLENSSAGELTIHRLASSEDIPFFVENYAGERHQSVTPSLKVVQDPLLPESRLLPGITLMCPWEIRTAVPMRHWALSATK